MKQLLFLITIISLSFGVEKSEIYKLYKNKDYINTCKKGTWILNENKTDDNYLSVVALSCVKADMINTAIRISKYMIHTPIGRNNASYIASIFLIKKLLLQMMFDNIDISNLSLPKSNHILSIVFENISHGNYSKIGDIYIVEQNGYRYTLSKVKNEQKISIKIYRNGNLLSEHLYW